MLLRFITYLTTINTIRQQFGLCQIDIGIANSIKFEKKFKQYLLLFTNIREYDFPTITAILLTATGAKTARRKSNSATREVWAWDKGYPMLTQVLFAITRLGRSPRKKIEFTV